MVTMKRLLVIVTVVLFSACEDEDKSAIRNEFKFDGIDAVRLKDATIYVVSEAQDANGRLVRDYAITDGEYLDGDGLSLGDYTDNSYLLVVTLGTAEQGEVFTDGNYRLYHDFSGAPETSGVARLSFQTTANVHFETSEAANGEQAIKIAGDYEHSDTMTITFDGTLTNVRTNEEAVAGKIYCKGKVNNLLTGARSTARIR